MYKDFLAPVYIKDGAAVRGFDDPAVLNTDPAAAAAGFDNGIIDELVVFDLSVDDDDRGTFYAALKKICNRVRIPVTAAIRDPDPEKIRTLFESGCHKAAFDSASDRAEKAVLFVASEYGQSAAALFSKKPVSAASLPKSIRHTVSELIDLSLSSDTSCGHNAAPIIRMLSDPGTEEILKELKKPSVGGILADFTGMTDREIYGLKKTCDSAGIPVFLRKAVYSWDELKKDDKGLIPVVVQEDATGQVLMVAYMNEEAYEHTVMTGHMTYFSRSRQSLWIKGETSGHFQYIRTLSADCDYDTLLARIEQIGAACHTGHHSCFFREDMAVPDRKFYKPLKIRAAQDI